jgi:hypothetical protein
MTTYVWCRAARNFVLPHEVKRERNTSRSSLPMPAIQSDYPMYLSPLGDGPIEGRAAKREHHKRTNTRAIDPSEQKPVYRNPEFARKRGLKLGGDPLVGGRLPTTVDANWKDHG